MAFTRLTKQALVSMMTSQQLADELESRMFTSTPASASAAEASLAQFDRDDETEREIRNRLSWGMAASGKEGQRLAQKIVGMIAVLRGKANGDEIAAVAAEATLDLTADITLTSVATGAARNTETFTLAVEAAAANPTDTVLADFTGTSDAIVCTITPNDGTNNGATPVDLTTAELTELINTGAVAGKNVTVTDASAFRALQTATGGDATNLADAGEGDGEIGTFANGSDASDTDIVPAQVEMGDELMTDDDFEILKIAIADKAAAEEFRTAYDAMVTAIQAVS